MTVSPVNHMVIMVRADLPADWTAPSAPVNVPVAMHAVVLV